ncbi:MAG: Holliday junction resolvase RuvX [Pyrinomonadaceae bacterium]
MSNSNASATRDEPQPRAAKGRLLALDLGTKRIGVAISDELQLSVRSLPPLKRAGWKQLLKQISELRHTFDAQAVVIGLPLRLDGTQGDAALKAHLIARNLSLSLHVPIYLQDERLTSQAAEKFLRDSGFKGKELTNLLDGEAAVLILEDFISRMSLKKKSNKE